MKTCEIELWKWRLQSKHKRYSCCYHILIIQIKDEEKFHVGLSKSLTYYEESLNIRADAEKLSVGRLIGTGGFKKVYEGRYAGDAVAVSVLHGTAHSITKSKRKTKLLARELRAMSMLSNHPGVPTFYGYCKTQVKNSDEEQLVLVNEFCERGDLTEFIETEAFEQMSTHDRMMLCVDILRVLDVMHGDGIFHRM